MCPDLVQVRSNVGDVVAVEPDVTLAGQLQQVDASEQRRFPASRGADHHLDVALLQSEIDAAEHVVLTEPLVDPLQADDGAIGVRHHAPPPVTPTNPERRRRSTLFTTQIIGSVMMRYPIAAATKNVALNVSE